MAMMCMMCSLNYTETLGPGIYPRGSRRDFRHSTGLRDISGCKLRASVDFKGSPPLWMKKDSKTTNTNPHQLKTLHCLEEHYSPT